ncbi:4-hydroxybenzoate octaprenyltransferase [Nymphaea thermarum]|nr:4-hydroxybenzoate octaprenyltransferase [Nymphaea thermarum]
MGGIALATPPGRLPDLSLLWVLAWVAFFEKGLACTIDDIFDRDLDAKPSAFLGLTLSCGILMGWSAVKGSLSIAGIFPLFTSCVMWTMVHDTMYAQLDKKDDVKAGVKSVALMFGESTMSWISGFGVATITFFLLTGYTAGLGWPYYAFLAVAAAQLVWQIWTLDISRPENCFERSVSIKPILRSFRLPRDFDRKTHAVKDISDRGHDSSSHGSFCTSEQVLSV